MQQEQQLEKAKQIIAEDFGLSKEKQEKLLLLNKTFNGLDVSSYQTDGSDIDFLRGIYINLRKRKNENIKQGHANR